MKRTLAVATAALAVAAMLPASEAFALARPPVLKRFLARFNSRAQITYYVATADDPEGGKLTFAWSLRAACGYLIYPKTTGPANGYQHGPKAKSPSGCAIIDETAAILTVRISDPEGCAIEYTQGARDERIHENPPTAAIRCVAAAGTAGAARKGFPAGLVLFLVVLAAGAGAFFVARKRPVPTPEPAAWDTTSEPGWSPPAPVETPQPAVTVLGSNGDASPEQPEETASWISPEPAPEPASPPSASERSSLRRAWARFTAPKPAPPAKSVTPSETAEPITGADEKQEETCTDGEVRNESNDVVAHDTVLAGAVMARVISGTEVLRQSEVPPATPGDASRLLDGLTVSPQAPAEIEIEIPLRLVTVVTSRREICREGRWTGDMRSATHDGPERIERLRAKVTARADLDAFVDRVLARRLGSLVEARRRLETSLAKSR